MNTNLENKRIKINELLKQATDEKLVKNNNFFAVVNLLEQAYELAKSDRDSLKLWSQVCAYRLAHVKMRMKPDLDDLYEIDQLFVESIDTESLGPLPALYRIAILIRIKQLDSESDIQSHLDIAFQKARERCIAFSYWHVDNQDFYTHKPVYHRSSIQNSLFNFLEFACYAANLDYDGLSGLGNDVLSSVYPEIPSWVLVGNDPKMSAVRYPKRYALEELKERMNNESEPHIFFKLSHGEKEHHIRYGNEPWKRFSKNHLIYLANLLTGKLNQDLQQNESLYDDRRMQNQLRQIKSRFLDSLATIIPIGKEKLILTNEDGIQLNPKVKVIGAVEAIIIDKYPQILYE